MIWGNTTLFRGAKVSGSRCNALAPRFLIFDFLRMRHRQDYIPPSHLLWTARFWWGKVHILCRNKITFPRGQRNRKPKKCRCKKETPALRACFHFHFTFIFTFTFRLWHLVTQICLSLGILASGWPEEAKEATADLKFWHVVLC